ncbi:unnamed protein product [Coffea canephora]|uniref:Germin-like protein n=2 Tax=Coffea TaxID=13442 RepID=A0A068URC2_COFCA|nr:putative germin-like protein 2-1 [Coffea arabica]CDP10148.1 unnamed protein product [Coffea canephora]
MGKHMIFSCFLALTLFNVAFATDPMPLQDFCVADNSSPVWVNGVPCKDPKLVTAEDFFFTGLNIPGNTSNAYGSKVTSVSVAEMPGLNTLGVSMARIDFAPKGVNPPLFHPRATGILTVLEGTLLVGFVTSNPENRLITKVVQKGDVFVIPVGLVHFHRNVGDTNAVAVAAYSSQNPDSTAIGKAVFGSTPLISDDVLAKAFQVNRNTIDGIQSKF